MNNKVCMFVMNQFTNDARVLRECTALSDAGYDVDLICIHDPKDPNLPRFEQRSDFFKVHRLRRYPLLLELMQTTIKYLMLNKVIGLFVFIL
jgi:hypothetical protein